MIAPNVGPVTLAEARALAHAKQPKLEVRPVREKSSRRSGATSSGAHSQAKAEEPARQRRMVRAAADFRRGGLVV
jgi:hypothetical protein